MNEKQVAFLVGFFLITLFAIPGSIIPANGQINTKLIAYYPLNTNANDYSGHSLNGKNIGVTFTTNNGGKVGESAIFSNNMPGGSAGINLPISPLLTFYHDTSFSIMAWVKTTSTNTMEIFAQQACTTGTVQVYLSDGKANFRLEDVNNIDTYLTSSVSNINDGQWHNVTATRDGTNHEMYLFIDGKETSTKDTTTGTLTNPSTLNTIGKRYMCGTTNNFIGNIDEVKIYSNQNISTSAFSDQTNSVQSSSNTNTNNIPFFILMVGIIFAIGSALGIMASNKHKKLSREQSSQPTTPVNITIQTSKPQNTQNSPRRPKSFCLNCGHPNGLDDIFCDNCGNRITF